MNIILAAIVVVLFFWLFCIKFMRDVRKGNAAYRAKLRNSTDRGDQAVLRALERRDRS